MIEIDSALRKLLETLRTSAQFQHARPASAEDIRLMLDGLFTELTPQRRWKMAVALGEIWHKDEKSKDVLAAKIAFEKLLELTKFDTAPETPAGEKPYQRLADDICEHLLQKNRGPRAYHLARIVDLRRKAGPWERGERFRQELAIEIAKTIREKPVLALTDGLVRWLGPSTGWFGEDLRTKTTPRLETKGWPAHPPVVWHSDDDAIIREAVRAQVREALVYAKQHSLPAATLASLQLIAAEGVDAGLELTDLDTQLSWYKQARADKQLIAADLSDYQIERWEREGNEESHRMHVAAQDFQSLFGAAPDLTTGTSLGFTGRYEDGRQIIRLDQPGEHQSRVCQMIANGDQGRAMRLVQGTAWTGVFNRYHMSMLDTFERRRSTSLCPQAARYYLLQLSVPAMWLAYDAGRFGIAAALGQQLLMDLRNCRTSSLGEVHSAIGGVAAACVRECFGSLVHANEDPFADHTREIVSKIIAMAEHCLDVAIEKRFPLHLKPL